MSRLRSVYVNCGDDFLGNASTKLLKHCYLAENDVRARQRLQAAFLRKQGKTLVEIADVVGRPFNTVSDWLRRFERKGLKCAKDKPRSGRPKRLSRKQLFVLRRELVRTPTEFGYSGGFWTTRLVQEHVRKRFRKKFVARHMRRLLQKLGFSLKKPRPRDYRADKAEQKHFKKNFHAWFPSS